MQDTYKIEIWSGRNKTAEFTSTSFKAIRKWFEENYIYSYIRGYCAIYLSKNNKEINWKKLLTK